jgi:hypothetical protein
MLTQLHEEFLDLAGADVPALEVLRIHAQRLVGDGALGARELLPVFEAAQARWMGGVSGRTRRRGGFGFMAANLRIV